MIASRQKILLLVGVLLACALLGWRSGGKVRGVDSRPVAAAPINASGATQVAEVRAVRNAEAAEVIERKLTRSEAAQRVRVLYRHEQLTRELDLEQRRYGNNYWESPRGGSGGANLERERAALLAALNAEANAVLSEFFPGDTGEPVVLTAFFDADHAGPNLTFLAPTLRARFEAEMLGDENGRSVDAESLRVIAGRVLTADSLAVYRQWNDAAAAALRSQLIGFDPTEQEFNSIRRDRSLAEETGEAPASSALEALLGVDRFAALQKLQTPALQAALHDLQRLDRPLAEAEWLASTRARAVADIGAIWRSATLTDAMKREQVAQVERACGQAIAARLGLTEAALDGLAPGS